MNLAQAIALRDAAYSAWLNALNSGVSSYGVNGRSVAKIDVDQLAKNFAMAAAMVNRLQGAGVGVAQFRDPE